MVEPPANGMFMRRPIMLGAIFVPISFQFVIHFIIIIKHMYANVTVINIIIGKNSKRKSKGYLKYNAFDALKNSPLIK